MWKLEPKPGCVVPLIEKVVELLGLRNLFKRKNDFREFAGQRARPFRDELDRHNEVTDDHRDEVDHHHHYVALGDCNCPCEMTPFQNTKAVWPGFFVVYVSVCYQVMLWIDIITTLRFQLEFDL